MTQEIGDTAPLKYCEGRVLSLSIRSTYPRGSTFSLGPLCLSFPEDCGGSGGKRPTDVPNRNRVMAKSRGKCSVRRLLVSSERNISVRPHVIYERRKFTQGQLRVFNNSLQTRGKRLTEKSLQAISRKAQLAQSSRGFRLMVLLCLNLKNLYSVFLHKK